MTDIVSSNRQWALYVFFGANVPDAGVREAAVQNLLQLATVGSSDDVAVAAQLHLPGSWAYRYAMPKRPPGSNALVLAPVETIPNVNSADPKTIIKFFEWAVQAYPADKTMLVVWGHGYGLDDYLPRGAKPHFHRRSVSIPLEQVSQSKNVDTANSNAYVALQIAKNQSIFNVILDECAHEVLPNAQVGIAARACRNAINRNLDILGLDACTMAMAEVWCELQHCAQIGIASEAQEPDASFPYDRFLARLMLEPDANPGLVAKMMVDAYVESYAYRRDTFVTLSACDLSESQNPPQSSTIELLLLSLKKLAEILKDAAIDPVKRSLIFRARNASPIFDPDGFIDLGRFCEILEVLLPDSHVSDACEAVRSRLREFILYARYSPLDPTLRISQTTGLSVWFPPWLEDPTVEIPEKEASIAYFVYGYPNSQFALSTDWHLFLESLWRNSCPEQARDLGTRRDRETATRRETKNDEHWRDNG
jgi:hypothetical protein